MILSRPVEISARLLPAVKIGGAWIHIEYHIRRDREGRTVYKYTIDLPGKGGSFEGTDLKSGRQGGDLREGLETLLCFLGYEESANAISPAVTKWTKKFSEEIESVRYEIQENPSCIIE